MERHELIVPKIKLSILHMPANYYEAVAIEYVNEDTYAVKYSVYELAPHEMSPNDNANPVHYQERVLSSKEVNNIVKVLKSTKISLLPNRHHWCQLDGADYKLEITPDFQGMQVYWSDAWPLDKVVTHLRNLALADKIHKRSWWQVRFKK